MQKKSGKMQSTATEKIEKMQKHQLSLFGICELCDIETEICNPLSCEKYFKKIKEEGYVANNIN